MGRIDLNLPNEAQLLFNHLNADMRASDLTSDLVGIKLPDGYLIDVRDCAKINWSKSLPVGSYGINPFSMKLCRLYVEFCHLFVANFDAFFIDTGVEGGTDC